MLKILIIASNTTDRELYKKFLSKEDNAFDVHEAADIEQGMALVKKEAFDCLIIDAHLPRMTGQDFIMQCKQESLQPDMAMVIVTDSSGTANTIIEDGSGYDYITQNSISAGFFPQTVSNAVERARLQHDVKRLNEAFLNFSHTLSHDLKAPVRRMAAFCDLLQEECRDALNEQGRQYVDRIIVNARRMQTLIEELQVYSRVLYMDEDRREIDLNLTVRDVITELAPLVQKTKASIRFDELPAVMAFPSLIKQIFLNLLTNAMKYTGDKAPVIHIGAQDKEGRYVIMVADNGEGVAPEYQEQIFKPFERLHTNEEVEGTGLGLAICQKAVEKLGGDIWMQSEAGKGAKFYFSLPKTGPLSSSPPQGSSVQKNNIMAA